MAPGTKGRSAAGSGRPHFLGCDRGSRPPTKVTMATMSFPVKRVFCPRTSVLALAALALACTGGALSAQRSADSTGTLTGTVLDQASGRPLADVTVLIEGARVGTSTAADGRFRMILPPGVHTLLVRHLAYGEHSQAVSIDAGGSHTVQIKISEQAIELAPLVVEALTDLDRRKRTSGTRINEIARPEIDDAQRRGIGLGELLRQGMPSLSLRGNCVEYRGARRGSGPCREVYAIMDGVPVSSPSMLVQTMPLQDIERLEMLSPAEAGAIYGAFSGFGVLLIETRRGPTRERLRAHGPALSSMDWSLEAQPYDWSRVALSSFVGTSLGLATGMLVGSQCLKVSETDFSGLRPKCAPVLTMGAGFFMLGLPGLAGGTAARWAGATDRSQGRLAPSALLSTLSVASGYLIWVEGKTTKSDAARIAGISVLFVGTPLLTAFSDRLFRALR
ncbi:MAG: hypothetical protein EXR95_03610 [Gemmatimonadetes bacterium]|nr:hypothetical protein [Gemmatimonadota bacterium]